MLKVKNLTEEELVACEICLKEVPVSGAKSDETSDYVAHFCGLECHSRWIGQKVKGDDSIKK